MRLLTCLAAVVVPLLITSRTFAAQACEKDVYLYFDVSLSMYETHRLKSAEKLFTDSVAWLLREEGFVDPGDRIVVVAFAENTVDISDDVDPEAAADAVEKLASQPPVTDVGDRNYTNVNAVLADVQSRLDPTRKQIFIIASDFAHHPPRMSCAEGDKRLDDFQTGARAFRRAVGNDKDLKIALLTGDVLGDSCGGVNKEVAQTVRTAFRELLKVSGEVPINRGTNLIAGELRRVIAAPIEVSGVPAPEDPALLGIRITNPNPFAVNVTQVHLSKTNQQATVSFPQQIRLGCGASEVLSLAVPPSLNGENTLHVRVDANTQPPQPVEVVAEQLLITVPEIHVFENLRTTTKVLELELIEQREQPVELIVEGASASKLTYKVDVSEGPRRVALVLPANAPANASAIKVSTPSGTMFVRTSSGNVQQNSAEAERAADREGEKAPVIVGWMSLVALAGIALTYLKLIPGMPLWWWKRFADVQTFFDFTGALDAGVKSLGSASSMIGTFGGYCGAFRTNITFENILWAAAAGFVTLMVSRSIVVNIAWKAFIEPITLKDAHTARKRRRIVEVLLVIAAVATALHVLQSLDATLPNGVVVHAAGPS